MFDEIGLLIGSRWHDLLENTGIAILLMKDPVGRWEIADFEVIYANMAARKIIPRKLAGKIFNEDTLRPNTLKNQIKIVQHHVASGGEGAIGPFAFTTKDAHGKIIYLEFDVMYVGDIQKQRTFWVAAMDKTQHPIPRQPERSLAPLSNREISIAKHILKGKTTKQIAQLLCVSVRTVDNHRTNIRRKLKITNKAISLSQHLRNLHIL